MVGDLLASSHRSQPVRRGWKLSHHRKLPPGDDEGAIVSDEYVVVGRIGRAHGLKGEVSVEPRTDEPERRFVVDAVLGTEGRAPWASLTVPSVRTHQGRLLVRFAEIADRTAAESARGTQLTVPVTAEETPEDPEEFYDHQ